MAWSRKDFLAILETQIATELFNDKEILEYVRNFTDDHKAALLHANGITKDTQLTIAKQRLQLVAAFARKDLKRLEELVYIEKVSVGARLDYMLPLYDKKNDGGEDIFVASTKVMLKGNEKNEIHLQNGAMKHKLGVNTDKNYSENELREIEKYVNNAFAIRKLFQAAPNKETIQPTRAALDYMIANAATYHDTNDNPTIVFIPGALSIQNYPIPSMIENAVKSGANINDVGFFGTPGIVWSIILGDVESVKKFRELGARMDIEDDMGNKNLAAWASTTYQVAQNNNAYKERLITILQNLSKHIPTNKTNNLGMSAFSYLDWQAKSKIFIGTGNMRIFQSYFVSDRNNAASLQQSLQLRK